MTRLPIRGLDVVVMTYALVMTGILIAAAAFSRLGDTNSKAIEMYAMAIQWPALLWACACSYLFGRAVLSPETRDRWLSRLVGVGTAPSISEPAVQAIRSVFFLILTVQIGIGFFGMVESNFFSSVTVVGESEPVRPISALTPQERHLRKATDYKSARWLGLRLPFLGGRSSYQESVSGAREYIWIKGPLISADISAVFIACAMLQILTTQLSYRRANSSAPLE